MALGVSEVLDGHVKKAVLSVPVGTHAQNQYSDYVIPQQQQLDLRLYTVMEGAKNNIPDGDAIRAAEEIKHVAEQCLPNDILLVLISGGGSALLPAPPPDISLAEKTEIIKMVAGAGGAIHQLNTVRKHLSLLKGGKLALLCPSSCVISLIISDIVNDPLDLIASAPTVYDSSSIADCFRVFNDLNLKMPNKITDFLQQQQQQQQHAEKNFNNNKSLIESKCNNTLIGNNKTALDSAARVASEYGFQTLVISSAVEGEAYNVGQLMGQLASCILRKQHNNIGHILNQLSVRDDDLVRELETILQKNSYGNICLIFGGETTVKVVGDGRGGRNQHLVLSMLQYLTNEVHTKHDGNNEFFKPLTFLSAGTDGQDGPTDAAGASIDVDLIKHFSVDSDRCSYIKRHLLNCGSYDFFKSTGSFVEQYLLQTGLTGTNVMDVQIMLFQHQ